MARDVVRIEVHKSLQNVLEDVRRSLAIDMKTKYGLKEITVPRTLSSQIAAARLKGVKNLNIKIRKTGLDRGVLEIIGF